MSAANKDHVRRILGAYAQSDLEPLLQTIHPDIVWITQAPPHVVDAALALPGDGYVAYLADDREVSDPNSGEPISGSLSVRIPRGEYRLRFFSPTSGTYSSAIGIKGSDKPVSIPLGPLEQDLVVEISRASQP